MEHRGTTALITGASSGLGVEFARQLAARGADLVLVARRTGRLEDVADAIRTEHRVAVTTVTMDLAVPGVGAAMHREVTKRGLEIDTLVNNAGFGYHGHVVDQDPARLTEMIQLNVTSLVDLTRAFLPDLVRGRGALVNIASTGAYQPTPHLAVYGATKSFVLDFTEALRAEVRGTGLTVLALSPGPTRTEFFDVAGPTLRPGGQVTPAEVVGLAMRTLDRRRPPASVIHGLGNRAMAVAAGVLPRRLVLTMSEMLLAPKSR